LFKPKTLLDLRPFSLPSRLLHDPCYISTAGHYISMACTAW
jgi:hypothetical protein